MSSRYREINPSAFSSDSTWMNLGLWDSDNKFQTFTFANEALALEIARHLRPKRSAIVDLGCGRGDSLDLWARIFPDVIYGINYSKVEYQAACRRFEGNDRIRLYLSDAVTFLKEDPLILDDHAIISVDAAYHFLPDRDTFLQAAKKSGASCIACSDIVLSERWAREWNRLDFLTSFFRNVFLWVICKVAGIPRSNLSYGPKELITVLETSGWNNVHVDIVTSRVFVPFSDYCSRRAKSLSWFSRERWSLISSGGFMRLLAWLEAVDFVIYSAS